MKIKLFKYWVAFVFINVFVIGCDNPFVINITDSMIEAREASITYFSFEDIAANVIINESAKSIRVIMPHGNYDTDFAPIITYKGANINPSLGEECDFSNPVNYTITSKDGKKTVEYTVTVIPTYYIGDTGPGGGIIFYRRETGFTVQGYGSPDNSGYFPSYTAYYLEVNTNHFNGTWSTGGAGIDIPGTAGGIGTGRKNTALILSIDPTAPLASQCVASSFGGRNDWFLPSIDELRELYYYYDSIGNNYNEYYYSSTQTDSWNAASIYFLNGGNSQGKSSYNRALPVRAF